VQSFLRSAAEAVGSEGGGEIELEEHAAATIARARIPDLTNASPSLVGAIVAYLRGHKRRILDPYRYNCKA